MKYLVRVESYEEYYNERTRLRGKNNRKKLRILDGVFLRRNTYYIVV